MIRTYVHAYESLTTRLAQHWDVRQAKRCLNHSVFSSFVRPGGKSSGT